MSFAIGFGNFKNHYFHYFQVAIRMILETYLVSLMDHPTHLKQEN